MTRVYLADNKIFERSALRLILHDLNMEIVGEASDWATTILNAPTSCLDMLLVDGDLLPKLPAAALAALRLACPAALVIVLISCLDLRQQAALSSGADVFINKGEISTCILDRIVTAAASIQH